MKADLGECLEVLAIVSDPLAQRILKRMLERAGHWPWVVSGEVHALEALDRALFDALIIDIDTLGAGTVRFISLVRMGRLGMSPLPVIALEFNTSASLLHQLEGLGVAAILRKPVAPKTLLDSLSRATAPKAKQPVSRIS